MGFQGPSGVKAHCTTRPCLRNLLVVLTFAAARLFVHACAPGKYGQLCDLLCNCEDRGELCTADGHCKSGCRAGYHGKGCMEKCSEQWYGVDCAKKCLCGQHCPCDPVTGACSDPDCAHQSPSTTDAFDRKTLWIILSLLGVCIFFVVLGLVCVCCRRKGHSDIFQKIKQTSLEQYLKKKALNCTPEQKKSSNQTINFGENLLQKRQVDLTSLGSTQENASASYGLPSNNSSCKVPVPKQLEAKDEQGGITNREKPLSDLHVGASITRGHRISRVKVIYVPPEPGVTGTPDRTAYENAFEVIASKFKTPGSARLVGEGSVLANMLQMDPVYRNHLPVLLPTKASSVNYQSSADKKHVLPAINATFPPGMGVAGTNTRLSYTRTSPAQKPLGQCIKLSPEGQGSCETDRCSQLSSTKPDTHTEGSSDQTQVATIEKEIKGHPAETVYNTITFSHREPCVRKKIPVSQYDVIANPSERTYVRTESPAKQPHERGYNSNDVASKHHSHDAEPAIKPFGIKTVEDNFDTTDSQVNNFTEKSHYPASFSRHKTQSTVSSFSDRTASTISSFSDRTASTLSSLSDRTESTVSAFSDRTESTVSASSDKTVSLPSPFSDLAGSPLIPSPDKPGHNTGNRRYPKLSTDNTVANISKDGMSFAAPASGDPVSSSTAGADKMATCTHRPHRLSRKTKSPDHCLTSERETSCLVSKNNLGQSINSNFPLLQSATNQIGLPSQDVSEKRLLSQQCVDNQAQMPQRADETNSSIFLSAQGAIDHTQQVTTEGPYGKKPTGVKQLIFQPLVAKSQRETIAYSGVTESSLTSPMNANKSTEQSLFATSVPSILSHTGTTELHSAGKAGPSEQQETEIYEFNKFAFTSTEFLSQTSTVSTNNSQRPTVKNTVSPRKSLLEKRPSSRSRAHEGKSSVQFPSPNSMSAAVPARSKTPTQSKYTREPSPTLYVNEKSNVQTQKQLQFRNYSASSPNFAIEQNQSSGPKLELPALDNVSPAERQDALSPLPSESSPQHPGDVAATRKSSKRLPFSKSSRTSTKVQADVTPRLQAACCTVEDSVVQASSASHKTNQKLLKPKRTIHFPNVFKTRTSAREKAASRSTQKTKPMPSASKDHLETGACADASRRVKNSDGTGGRSTECREQTSRSPSPLQPHGALLGQRGPSRSPVRHGSPGLNGGNCQAFENTQYHLMGAHDCSLQSH